MTDPKVSYLFSYFLPLLTMSATFLTFVSKKRLSVFLN